MPSRRFPSRSTSRGVRPRYRWETQRTVPVTIPAGSTNFVNLTTGVRNSADGANRGGVTLMRSIGSISLEPVSSVASEIVAGMTQVDDAALAASAFPSLVTAFQENWIYWVYKVITQTTGQAALQIDFDIKSKRRYRDGDESTVFLIHNPDSTNSIVWSLGLRMLFKIGM